MPSLSAIRLNLAERLKDRAARRKFFRRIAQDEIAMQIRSLREKRGFLRQTDFAKQLRMQQSAVSRIEQADYQGWTYRTLLRVAEALDARLRITFEPAEDVIRRYTETERLAQRHEAMNYVTAMSDTFAALTKNDLPQVQCGLQIDSDETGRRIVIDPVRSQMESLTIQGGARG